MNREEKQTTRQILIETVFSTTQLSNDEKIERLMSYFNNIVRKYKTLDTFDNIEHERKKNMQGTGCPACCDICSVPGNLCRLFIRFIKIICLIMLLALFLCSFSYIIYRILLLVGYYKPVSIK